MFDKLLSALPYNPSLIHQLSFYAKRVRKEEAVRKIGIVFIALAFLVQFFAFVSPPQSTLADSPNDLINGGFGTDTSKGAAVAANYCRMNTQNYGTILTAYGITCDEVAHATTININSDSYSGDLWSMGRDPAGIAGETTVCVPDASPCPGGDAYYIRYLKGWDKAGTSSNYSALVTRSSTGQLMFLLYPCGNLVSVGPPVQVTKPTPTPKPKPKPVPCSGVISSVDFSACVTTNKKAINLTQGGIDATTKPAQANDLIRYYLYAKNTGTGVVKDYVFSDNLSYVLDYAHIAVLGTGKVNTATQTIIYPVRNIAPRQTASVYFEVRVNDPIPTTPESASDPNYFNMEMTNTYGHTVIIHLPETPIQTVENITTPTDTTGSVAATGTLPNTGPGTGFAIAAVVTVFAGFFFYRSRLLAKESVIALKENSGGF
jgi:hypothetical protein